MITQLANTNHQASDAAHARLPALFVSHGAPLFALEPGDTGPALSRLGAELRSNQPLRGVVVLSPHWMSQGLRVMTGGQPATWHDFGGFPRPLYALQYPAPGDPALADEVLRLLQAAGLPAQADAQRPYDHGAWVPLMHLFPQADVPVVQLSLPATAGPAEVLALGQALAPLRDQGVLLLGSGSMTHNLSEFFGGEREPAPYVGAFRAGWNPPWSVATCRPCWITAARPRMPSGRTPPRTTFCRCSLPWAPVAPRPAAPAM